jgi:hypothetical protein
MRTICPPSMSSAAAMFQAVGKDQASARAELPQVNEVAHQAVGPARHEPARLRQDRSASRRGCAAHIVKCSTPASGGAAATSGRITR